MGTLLPHILVRVILPHLGTICRAVPPAKEIDLAFDTGEGIATQRHRKRGKLSPFLSMYVVDLKGAGNFSRLQSTSWHIDFAAHDSCGYIAHWRGLYRKIAPCRTLWFIAQNLAAYVASLGAESVPRSPHRNPNGSPTLPAISGKLLFDSLNCQVCHAGESLTDSTLQPVYSTLLASVGTVSGESGQRLGDGPLPGVDTPTLLGLFENTRFLHHGGAQNLEDMFSYAGGILLEAEEGEPVYSTDPGAVSLQVKDSGEGGGGGWSIHGVSQGRYLNVGSDSPAAETGVRFTGVDGGSGGSARLRVKASYGRWTQRDFILRVNGTAYRQQTLRTLIGSRFGVPQWQDFEVSLLPGATNTIEVLRPADLGSGSLNIDAIMVVTQDNLEAASAHRQVGLLSPSERQQLMSYLMQIDGSGPIDVVPPGEMHLTGSLDREYWSGISGSSLSDLTGLAAFPDAPDGADFLYQFEAVDWTDGIGPADFADNYGQRIRGYIVPQVTGEYTFWISSDDESTLALSSDETPENASIIARVNDWASQYEYHKSASQKSAPVLLQAGQPVYVEVLHKEGGGGDHLSVAWTLDPSVVPDQAHILSGAVLSAFSAGVPEPLLTTETAWLQSLYGNATEAQAALLWMEDPDQDGVSNLFEFIHGLNAMHPDAGEGKEVFESDDGERLILKFPLREDSGSFVASVEASVNLSSWSAVPRSNWNPVGTANGITTWQIELDLQPGSPVFVRLKVE